MGCTYKGEDYSDGAEICRNGFLFKCRGDGWVKIDDCPCGDEYDLSSVSVIVSYIRSNESEAAEFKSDPDGYFQKRLSMVGQQTPEGLHAHYIEEGKFMPPEDESILFDERNVFTFGPSGDVTFEDDTVSLAKKGTCSTCGICIVIRF